ncbi:hypothetical protein AAY473_026123 [Plecturocebus cupreus]
MRALFWFHMKFKVIANGLGTVASFAFCGPTLDCIPVALAMTKRGKGIVQDIASESASPQAWQLPCGVGPEGTQKELRAGKDTFRKASARFGGTCEEHVDLDPPSAMADTLPHTEVNRPGAGSSILQGFLVLVKTSAQVCANNPQHWLELPLRSVLIAVHMFQKQLKRDKNVSSQ